MEKGVRKTKRCCIVELYNYREEMITTLVYEEEAGEAFMKPLIHMMELADKYGYELLSVRPVSGQIFVIPKDKPA